MQRVFLWSLPLAGLCALAPVILRSDALVVRLDGDRLRVAAPNLRFLSGRPMERLKNGAAVPFDFLLLLWAETHSGPRRRAAERFVVSYDLWEEKFSVARWKTASFPQESVSHLSQTAAEAWCLDRLSLPVSELAPATDFWMRLEVRTAEAGPETPLIESTGVSLTGLIDWLSRSGRESQNRRTLEAGPLRIENLKR